MNRVPLPDFPFILASLKTPYPLISPPPPPPHLPPSHLPPRVSHPQWRHLLSRSRRVSGPRRGAPGERRPLQRTPQRPRTARQRRRRRRHPETLERVCGRGDPLAERAGVEAAGSASRVARRQAGGSARLRGGGRGQAQTGAVVTLRR